MLLFLESEHLSYEIEASRVGLKRLVLDVWLDLDLPSEGLVLQSQSKDEERTKGRTKWLWITG